MDGTRHTVVHLGVQLGKHISIMHTSLLHISHSSLLHDVPHQETLDSLVLGAALGAVGAADVLDVAAAMLVAPAVPPLERHGRFAPLGGGWRRPGEEGMEEL